MVKAGNFHGIDVDEVVVPRILSAAAMSASLWGSTPPSWQGGDPVGQLRG